MDRIERAWAEFRRQPAGTGAGSQYTVRRIGASEAMCEQLLQLITAGEKTGSFSLPGELREADVFPAAGDYVMLTHFDGRPACVVRIETVETLPFAEIGPRHTACESEAARELSVWRDIHRRYWSPMLAARGQRFSEDIPVVFQRFALLWTV